MKNTFLKAPTIITPRKAAGDFTASVALDTMLKAESMWSEGAQANQYKSNAEAARAVLTNQTAEFRELDDKDHDKTLVVTWLNACAIVPEDCEANCTISGDELQTTSKEYAYDLCKKVDFSINRNKLRTGTYNREEQIAKGLALSVKALDEWWAQRVLISLSSYAGINVAPSPYTFNDADMTTEVPAASYNLNMYANLQKQAVLNQMNSPYYIEKGDLWVPQLDAELDEGNAEGKGLAERASRWGMYFDLFNFGKAGITDDLFAIDRSAVAMKTYNRYPETPTPMNLQTHYSIASQSLPGVRYGVIYQLTCETSGTTTIWRDTWRIITEGMIALNPEGCPITIGEDTYEPTGVLSYSKTA